MDPPGSDGRFDGFILRKDVVRKSANVSVLLAPFLFPNTLKFNLFLVKNINVSLSLGKNASLVSATSETGALLAVASGYASMQVDDITCYLPFRNTRNFEEFILWRNYEIQEKLKNTLSNIFPDLF